MKLVLRLTTHRGAPNCMHGGGLQVRARLAVWPQHLGRRQQTCTSTTCCVLVVVLSGKKIPTRGTVVHKCISTLPRLQPSAKLSKTACCLMHLCTARRVSVHCTTQPVLLQGRTRGCGRVGEIESNCIKIAMETHASALPHYIWKKPRRWQLDPRGAGA